MEADKRAAAIDVHAYPVPSARATMLQVIVEPLAPIGREEEEEEATGTNTIRWIIDVNPTAVVVVVASVAVAEGEEEDTIFQTMKLHSIEVRKF